MDWKLMILSSFCLFCYCSGVTVVLAYKCRCECGWSLKYLEVALKYTPASPVEAGHGDSPHKSRLVCIISKFKKKDSNQRNPPGPQAEPSPASQVPLHTAQGERTHVRVLSHVHPAAGSPGLLLLPGSGAATPTTIVSSFIILNILTPFLCCPLKSKRSRSEGKKLMRTLSPYWPP